MKLITIFFLFIHFSLSAQVNLVPMPAYVKTEKGSFALSPSTKIIYGKAAKAHAMYLRSSLQKEFGLNLAAQLYNDQRPKDLKNSIQIFLRSDTVHSNEYALNVSKDAVYLDSQNDTLLFNGIQTILQLLLFKNDAPALKNYQLSIGALSIIDSPRFSYRGMHLDVCRHFFTVAEVKKYIDYLAFYKFNTFHWHLTDDQGWRIEIKKYPLLTQVGGCRAQTLIGAYGSNKYDGEKNCGYYTQSQIKEVVKYAADRYINIIPEIEMPGHAVAALTSYPYLGCTKGPYKTMETWGVSDEVFCAGNDAAYRFLEDVLAEVTSLFPSAYIHIGGDECPKERWKACPVCRQKMQTENLKNEHELQGYFIKRITKYLSTKGKNIIGWDEIMEGGIAPGATIMSWNGEGGGIAAAKLGHDAVMTPGGYCYFDHSQSSNEDIVTFGGYTPIEKVYGYEPVPAALSAEEGKHILGAQGNVWTEYIGNEKKLQYTVFPRMAALAEVLWSPKEKRNWPDFERRIPVLFEFYKRKNIRFSEAYYEPVINILPATDHKGLRVKISTKRKPAFFSFDKTNMLQPEIVKDSVDKTIFESAVYRAAILEKVTGRKTADQKPDLFPNRIEYLFRRDLEIRFNKATGKAVNLNIQPAANYPGNGAFTLVNGIQNNKGMSKSAEFLGFSGKNLDAVIDLGSITDCKQVILHSFTQKASWIYPPKNVQVFASDDGINFTLQKDLATAIKSDDGSQQWKADLPQNFRTRFIRIVAVSFGIIPAGNPGADNPAWLFADEIEVL